MVDFKKLLSKNVTDIKAPKPLVAGDYPGVIKSFELGDSNKNKTPYVRYFCGITGWPDEAEQEDREMDDGTPIDLSKRQLRRDFYLTDDSMIRLKDLWTDLGLEIAGKSAEECVPMAIGCRCTLEVQQYTNQTDGSIGNQIGKISKEA